MSSKYKMTISRLTVDKLGVKLYDKVSAVLAELVANSYDADATEVKISAPMGEYLATKDNNTIKDNGHTIIVEDNGIGMSPDDVNEFYLIVGAARRDDPKRGDTSQIYKRKVMGRKGVGKLAAFGICKRIEIITAGGDKVRGYDKDGNDIVGYRTAHLVLEFDGIVQDSDQAYYPLIGKLDDTRTLERGTKLILSDFYYRKVPDIISLERQLAQRFGIPSADWRMILFDPIKAQANLDYYREVGEFKIQTLENTEIHFTQLKGEQIPRPVDFSGNIRTDIEAGFTYKETFYPITGWVAYAKEPYKDDLMAGVRIYCRRKIAAQTAIFNLKAGFTGEYDVRSYLVGELYADWLDDDEDLIQTDRKDILWSHELGQVFEAWGQSIIRKLGTMTRQPMKTRAWEKFKEVSQIDTRIHQEFPSDDQEPIRERAMALAKVMGQAMHGSSIDDAAEVESVVNISLTLAPHVTLTQKLQEVAEQDSPLSALTNILRTARVAELSSFGNIAFNRVRVIEKVDIIKNDPDTVESTLQKLIEEAPWIIDPQWSPITANQSFTTLKEEFARFYMAKTGSQIQLGAFNDPTKRADFVLSTQENVIQIIEIKRPSHKFENEEMERLENYIQKMEEFLADDSHKEFTKIFNGFHVTLVCDGERLTGVHRSAFQRHQGTQLLTYLSWAAFLASTKKMHQEFLAEAERQKQLALNKVS